MLEVEPTHRKWPKRGQSISFRRHRGDTLFVTYQSAQIATRCMNSIAFLITFHTFPLVFFLSFTVLHFPPDFPTVSVRYVSFSSSSSSKYRLSPALSGASVYIARSIRHRPSTSARDQPKYHHRHRQQQRQFYVATFMTSREMSLPLQRHTRKSHY